MSIGERKPNYLRRPKAKAVVAAQLLLDLADGTLREEDAGVRLRFQVGLNWSVLTCVQYLSGKEAVSALTALPDDWSDLGRTKSDLLHSAAMALNMVNTIRGSRGGKLSSGKLADRLHEIRAALSESR